LGELRDVISGSDESYFLCGPPGETDGILDGEFGQLSGGFENGNAARSVIVDSGSCWDGVGVTANEEDVVFVTCFGLGNDIVTS